MNLSVRASRAKNVFKALALSFGILGVLIFVNAKNPGYLGVHPHPYLVLGIFAGLILGLMGSMLLAPILAGTYVYFMAQGSDPVAIESLFTLKSLALPLSMIGLPAALGAISDRARLKIHRGEESLNKNQLLLQDLERVNEILVKEKSEVEAKVTTQEQTVSRVIGFAMKLESTDLKELAETFVSFLCDQLSEDNAYFFQSQSGQLRRVAFLDSAPVAIPEVLSQREIKNYALIEHALESKAFVTTEVLPPSKRKGGESGVAVPLISEVGTVMGLIYIRHLHFLNMKASSLTIIKSISSWASTCLSRVLRIYEMESKSYRDQVTGLFSQQYLTWRLQSDLARANRYGEPLTMLRFEVSDLKKLLPLQRYAVEKLFAHKLKESSEHLKLGNVCCRTSSGSYYCIFSTDSKPELEKYRNEVQESFDDLVKQFSPHEGLNLSSYKTALDKNNFNVQDFLAAEESW